MLWFRYSEMDLGYSFYDDEDLWTLIQERADEEAFACLHERYAGDLYRLAYRKTGHVEASEDIVQELFIALWVQRKAIRIEQRLRNYLYTSLKNRVISYLRDSMISKTTSLSAMPLDNFSSLSGNTVEELLTYQDTRDRYEQILSSIPEKSRLVFELSRNGLSNKEIAASLNVVEKTVEFHISKCLKLLREKLVHILLIFSQIIG